jgi:hypothetical protein
MAAIKEVLERNQLYAFGVEAPQAGNRNVNCTVNTNFATLSNAELAEYRQLAPRAP